jgi:hypothetical protein
MPEEIILDNNVKEFLDKRIDTNYTLDRVNIEPEQFVQAASSALMDYVYEIAQTNLENGE